VDGTFGYRITFKFILERFDNRGRREQAAVIRKRPEPNQDSFILEGWNPVTDGLGRLRWHSGRNRRANFVQSAAAGFWDASKIFINISRSLADSSRRPVSAGLRSFHADNTTALHLQRRLMSVENPESAIARLSDG